MRNSNIIKGLCLYHDHCNDGFAAALAVWLVYGDNYEYVPVRYGEQAPDVTNRDVIIVDFSYPRETLLKMKNDSSYLLVVDHHKTAENSLKGLDYCIFDNSKSGAVLAWEHFHPVSEVPDLFLYIQDRDLWQWKLEYSRELNAALRVVEKDFKIWKDLCFNKDLLSNLIDKGSIILEYQKTCVESAIKGRNLIPIKLGGYDVAALNVTHLVSETIGRLAEFGPFAVGYFDTSERRYFSLRSTKQSGIDVAEIAKQYGGGGHANAAGFSIPLPPVFPVAEKEETKKESR